MQPHGERRKDIRKLIGIERRGALIDNLNGKPLPDPTLLEDEDFTGWKDEEPGNTGQEELGKS